MPWNWAALMPHPPVLVPDVGRGRESEAAVTVEGLRRVTDRLASRRPDCLLLLSPHQPYVQGGVFLNASAIAAGSLADFGAPSAAFELRRSGKLQTLAEHLTKNGFSVRLGESPGLSRDQGSLVPLYFLRQAWQKGGERLGAASGVLPPTVLASPIGIDPASALALGEALASFEDAADWGLLASGDLSHRLTQGAPAGYSPAGKKFDEAAVAALSSADPEKLLALSPEDLRDAGECGLRSVMAMLGLCRACGKNIEVLSYEGPFGVGYCSAFSDLKG